MIITVGSQNPTKRIATQLAFSKVWPNKKIEINSIKTDSGISPQPLTNAETIIGAKNRAIQAIKLSKSSFGVGLEGGLHQINGKWFDGGWAVVIDNKGNEGIGSTAGVEVPQKIMDIIGKGYELGEAIDTFFSTTNARQKEGFFGLITNNAITRSTGYSDAVVMALSRFINPKVY